MKHMTTILLGISLVVITGLFTATVFGVIGSKANTVSGTSNTMFSGHVTTTLRDSEGNIKAYRQTDNAILNAGENCAAKMLFGASAGAVTSTGSCTGAITDGFRYIGIGNYTTNVNGTNYVLGQEYTTAAGSLGQASGLTRGVATGTMTNSTGATGSTSQSTVVLSKTFSSARSAAQIVQESGLFNSTTVAGSGMFARQTFSAINVGTSDSLTVTWTITFADSDTT